MARRRRPCPVEKAGKLDSRWRRWLQHPRKMLRPHVSEGMTVLDLGCGPGFFTIDLARLVGPGGRVIAADVQQGMLAKLATKIEGSPLAQRIALHRCEKNRIGVDEALDFVLTFYVVHEVPDQTAFFSELASLIKPDGRILVVEPPIHVSKEAFAKTIAVAQTAGLAVTQRPKIFLSKAVILSKTARRP
jgi:ubiquinone/menaquinone biosynthesis C-methylase UbiE